MTRPARSPWACSVAEVALGLGVLQGREAERLPGDGDVDGVVPDHLEEDARRRPALVELAGAVEVAGPEAHGGGDAVAVADGGAGVLERVDPVALGVDVGLDGDVVARPDLVEQGGQRA